MSGTIVSIARIILVISGSFFMGTPLDIVEFIISQFNIFLAYQNRLNNELTQFYRSLNNMKKGLPILTTDHPLKFILVICKASQIFD